MSENVPDGTVKRLRVKHPGGGVVRTKQAEKDSAHMGTLIKRWIKTGAPLPEAGKIPRYGDFSSGQTFHEAVNAVHSAEADFELLPAKVRTFCENDFGKFIEKALDPDGVRELLEAGAPEERLPAGAPPPGEPPTSEPPAEDPAEAPAAPAEEPS